MRRFPAPPTERFPHAQPGTDGPGEPAASSASHPGCSRDGSFIYQALPRSCCCSSRARIPVRKASPCSLPAVAARGRAGFAATSCRAEPALACQGRFDLQSILLAAGQSGSASHPPSVPAKAAPAARSVLMAGGQLAAGGGPEVAGKRERRSVETLPATGGMRNGQTGPGCSARERGQERAALPGSAAADTRCSWGAGRASPSSQAAGNRQLQ